MPASRIASMDSCGKRDSASTSAAWTASTSAPMRAAVATNSWGSVSRAVVVSTVVDIGASSGHRVGVDADGAERGRDGGDRLEGRLAEQLVGELHVELVLQRAHHVDAGVAGQAGSVEVVLAPQRVHVDGQAPVVAQDAADGLVHAFPPDGSRAGPDGGEVAVSGWARPE